MISPTPKWQGWRHFWRTIASPTGWCFHAQTRSHTRLGRRPWWEQSLVFHRRPELSRHVRPRGRCLFPGCGCSSSAHAYRVIEEHPCHQPAWFPVCCSWRDWSRRGWVLSAARGCSSCGHLQPGSPWCPRSSRTYRYQAGEGSSFSSLAVWRGQGGHGASGGGASDVGERQDSPFTGSCTSERGQKQRTLFERQSSNSMQPRSRTVPPASSLWLTSCWGSPRQLLCQPTFPATTCPSLSVTFSQQKSSGSVSMWTLRLTSLRLMLYTMARRLSDLRKWLSLRCMYCK